MEAAWVAVGLTALGMVAGLVGVLIKVALALAANTAAVKELSNVLAEQKAVSANHDARLDNHESRIVAVETVHKLRGCNEAP